MPVVNEALTHTDPPNLEAVEIFNSTAEAIDIRGWALSDSRAVPVKVRIPFDSKFVLEPGAYAVLDETDFTDNPGVLDGSPLPGYLSVPRWRTRKSPGYPVRPVPLMPAEPAR